MLRLKFSRTLLIGKSFITLADKPNVVGFCVHRAAFKHCQNISPDLKLFKNNDLTSFGDGTVIRYIAEFAPRNTKAPVRDPRVSENSQRKEEKKDKKPVISTDCISGKCGIATVIRKTEVTPEPPHRYEWGVKLHFPIEPSHETQETESSQGIAKRAIVEANKNDNPTKSSGNVIDNVGDAVKIDGNTGPTRINIAKSGESKITTTQGNYNFANNRTDKTVLNKSDEKKQGKTNTTVEPKQSTSTVAEKSKVAGTASKMNRQPMIPSQEMGIVDGDYNVPGDVTPEKQVSVWTNVIKNSSPPVPPRGDDWPEEMDNVQLQITTIPPEPPNPKLDVEIVKSADEYSTGEEIYRKKSTHSAEKDKPRGTKSHFAGNHIPIDSYVFKKFHTDSRCSCHRGQENFKGNGFLKKFKIAKSILTGDKSSKSDDLSALSEEEIARIYDTKNYAYMKREEIKYRAPFINQKKTQESK